MGNAHTLKQPELSIFQRHRAGAQAWGICPFYATEIKFTQNWIRLNKHESQDASWRQLPRRQVQVRRSTQKSQIKIALKDEDVENGGGTAEAEAGAEEVEGGAVQEVIEKHREIHKARNAQRALRVTEFNGNGSGCVCGAERGAGCGDNKKEQAKNTPSPEFRVPSLKERTQQTAKENHKQHSRHYKGHTTETPRTGDGNQKKRRVEACQEKFSKLTNFEIYTLRKWINPVRGNLSESVFNIRLLCECFRSSANCISMYFHLRVFKVKHVLRQSSK